MSYFKFDEFECKCGCGFNNIDIDLLSRLNMARIDAKVSFIINSGCRCNKHNKNVGGSPTSSHLRGLAVDIKCESSLDRQIMLTSLIKVGFKRIGISKTFLHVDVDPNKSPAIWLY